MAHGNLSMSIALGLELGLFEALAKAGNSVEPASAIDVARIANVKARWALLSIYVYFRKFKCRYCHEWLCCMACGEIIETDQTGQQFWISEDKLPILTGANPDKSLMAAVMLPSHAVAFKEVAKTFTQEGPLGKESLNLLF